MEKKLKLTRNQIADFAEDPNTVKQIELLLRIVNELQVTVEDLELRVEALENP